MSTPTPLLSYLFWVLRETFAARIIRLQVYVSILLIFEGEPPKLAALLVSLVLFVYSVVFVALLYLLLSAQRSCDCHD